MALQGGHRFPVSMAEAFPFGLMAIGIDQAMDYDAKNKRRTPTRDKQTNELVWTVTCMEPENKDTDQKASQVKIKVLAAVCPTLPDEIVPGLGIRPLEFSGMSVTPYIEEGRGSEGRSRLAYSWRATGVHAPGKAPAGSATMTGRSDRQAPPAGESKAA